MDRPISGCVPLADTLDRLLSQLLGNDSLSAWHDVELTSQILANILRTKDGPEDNHTILGHTSLPRTLTSLLKCALAGRSVPDDDHAPAVFEIFRVAANFCMDHDDNRSHLLEAGLPQAIVTLLEGYSDSESIAPVLGREPLPLSVLHLKVIRTAIGVLLNASLNYDPVKFRLISLEAAVTVLKLSMTIYPPGLWINLPVQQGTAVFLNSPENIKESWTLRCGLSNWVWRLISELKDVRDESRQILGPDILPFLIPSLLAFVPPFHGLPINSPFLRDSPLLTSLIQADFDILEESCMLIESLALDIEDVRLSLARGFNFPAEHNGIPCLNSMLDFIENGDYHPLWYTDSEVDDVERKKRERSFDICKAAIIKVVVEVAGEDKNEEVLWDDSEKGGDFVKRMVAWIKGYAAGRSEGKVPQGFIEGPGSDPNLRIRDDLVICASLSLGNLSKREPHATTLLSPPHSLAAVLASPCLLTPSADIKLKHGILGLTKHLAQSASQSTVINTALTEAGIVQRITASGVWDEMADAMADVIQLNAIGIVKYLCVTNVENTFALVIPAGGQEAGSTGLAQILELVRRSDSIAIKSEGTRVLVNITKSLLSGGLVGRKPTITQDQQGDIVSAEQQKRRQEALRLILKPKCASALANLVGRSGKYPVLINEGLVALSLLSTQREGALLVLNAILVPLPTETASGTIASPVSATTSSEASSPVVTSPATRTRLSMPPRAIDMLISVLKNVDTGSNIPPEVRANVCSLLLHMGKHLDNAGTSYARIKEHTRPVLEDLVAEFQNKEGKEGMLGAAAQRVLEAWA